MPIGTATITAKTGPGIEVEDKVVSGIQAFFVDLAGSVLHLKTQNHDPTGPGLEFDLNLVDTFTITISGATYTMVVELAD
jgi:hypothetical protein